MNKVEAGRAISIELLPDPLVNTYVRGGVISVKKTLRRTNDQIQFLGFEVDPPWNIQPSGLEDGVTPPFSAFFDQAKVASLNPMISETS